MNGGIGSYSKKANPGFLDPNEWDKMFVKRQQDTS